MRGAVVYYSQSGNTKKIAHAIHSGMSQVINECNITILKNIPPQELAEYDLIGLGSPWWGRIPPNVKTYIDSMVSMEGKHFFPFFTHGSLPAGCMHTTIPLLQQKGLTIIGFNDWYGNSIQQFIPYPHFVFGHPDDIDLKEAEDFGREMARLSQRIYDGETQLIPKPPTINELDEIYGQPFPPSQELRDAEEVLLQQRKINIEKCTNCGLCVENCPTGSIDFSVSPPTFRNNSCAVCWFCEQICPEGAIEMDWEVITKLHDGSLDFLNEHLEEAAAKGRFRRLISIEGMDRDYWYKITSHPRYIIE